MSETPHTDPAPTGPASRSDDANLASPPRALTDRPDLLAREAGICHETRRSWRGRLKDMGDYGTTGGSAADARNIVEWLAALEASR